MIVLVGCVKSKRAKPCMAKDMYVSTLFKGRVAWAENRGLPWYILSARYGLLRPTDEIAPYDLTLNTMDDSAIRSWSKKVCLRLEAENIIRKGETCYMLAGERYKRYLKRRYSVIDPFESLGLFRQVAELAKEIRGANRR